MKPKRAVRIARSVLTSIAGIPGDITKLILTPPEVEMKNVWRRLIPMAALLIIGSAAIADSLDDGRELYKAGKYAEAVTKLQQAAKEDPKNAKVYWQLNFAYNKLGKFKEALGAVQQAHALDPQHGFASEPGKYEETYNRLVQKAGGASNSGGNSTQTTRPPRSNGNSTAQGSGSGNIASQLQNGDVYVQSGANVDIARLEAVARELRPAQVKILVFNSRSNAKTLQREADRVRDYFNLKNGFVVAASRSAVAASGEKLSKDTVREQTKLVAPMMEAGDYTGGLEKLARGLVVTRKQQAQASTNMWLFILIGIGGAIIAWVIFRRASNASQMKELRLQVNRQRDSVVQSVNWLDDAAKGIALGGGRVLQERENAGRKLDEASRLMSRAKSANDLRHAKELLDSAEGDIARANAIIRGADEKPIPAGRANASAVIGSAVPTDGSDQSTDWTAIPENERGVCFFCSRPSKLNELTPVTVNLGEGDQKVLACAADLKTIRTGKMPNIRAFNDNGRQVPWYASNSYDPYRDYYPRYGMGDYMRDMVTLSVIDSMFWGWHRPMGWGWGYGYPYTFYPDHHYYSDWHTHHAADYGNYDSGPDNSGGTDFLGGGGGGGGDFGGSFGDSGGGTDFLGGDQS